MNNRPSSLRLSGFSLIELLSVMVIVSLVAAFAVPAVLGMLRGANVTGNLNEITDFLQQARAAAMASNSYVWVGVLPCPAGSPGNADGIDELVLAAVCSRNGQISDILQDSYYPLGKGRVLKNVTLQKFAADVLKDAGRETEGVDDISDSDLTYESASLKFSQLIGQMKNVGQPQTFTQLIQFGPMGNASVKDTASRWIEIGVKGSPGDGAVGVVQVNGLTGQTRIFRQ